jgi:hypothetical protein
MEIGGLYFCQSYEISEARTCYPMNFVPKEVLPNGFGFWIYASRKNG